MILVADFIVPRRSWRSKAVTLRASFETNDIEEARNHFSPHGIDSWIPCSYGPVRQTNRRETDLCINRVSCCESAFSTSILLQRVNCFRDRTRDHKRSMACPQCQIITESLVYIGRS